MPHSVLACTITLAPFNIGRCRQRISERKYALGLLQFTDLTHSFQLLCSTLRSDIIIVISQPHTRQTLYAATVATESDRRTRETH